MILRRNLLSAGLTVLTAGLLFGDSATGKPACSAAEAGKFWPPSANADSSGFYQSSHTGQLEVCTRGVYRYRWQPLTVSYQELAKEHKAKARTDRGKS